MAAVEDTSPVSHSPPPPNVKRPKGILKNSFQRSPPISPNATSSFPQAAVNSASPEPSASEKEVTIENTKINAGHRRSSSTAGSRPGGARRLSSRTPSVADPNEEADPRIKWDEANLYLTEQERTSTMKITEPKTPYAKHYDPAEDPSDDEQHTGSAGGAGSKDKTTRGQNEDEIPVMSLGEPEEAVPEIPLDEVELANNKRKHSGSGSRVHVVDDEEQAGLSPEEREKHRRFEEMRKKHYEMKEVTQFLGHPEDLDELVDEEDGDDQEGNGSAVPPVPPLPAGVNGRSA
ncbi:hypothetical protein M406DRAFT_354710 [Cryphonectria parasitica EP155]|uniref:Glc8 protein n=1 Tax=Cryphonectria parasitica (strain ATCC 38755 / EP155) TaxID=660469 RepID=A0A9P4YD34_CRYP1|nr:uncharacterized protein M406DRAFT_354710 [Cryphonectria parasitica EP155]KAF3771148.1 hypothetical protein M406DRAFT_354710 [Cryphonectria parasitica EP155]